MIKLISSIVLLFVTIYICIAGFTFETAGIRIKLNGFMPYENSWSKK